MGAGRGKKQREREREREGMIIKAPARPQTDFVRDLVTKTCTHTIMAADLPLPVCQRSSKCSGQQLCRPRHCFKKHRRRFFTACVILILTVQCGVFHKLTTTVITEKELGSDLRSSAPVSYTHLTLPTKIGV